MRQTHNAPSIIESKRDGRTLSEEQIKWIIQAYMHGEVSEEQMAALLMAIYLKGMNLEETVNWTLALIDSGETLNWGEHKHLTTDKHSTGGVGDKVTLVLTPLVASLGALVPQISGRGLGHTGGTLDKLESIKGFRSALTSEELHAGLAKAGCFIASATESIAPADKRLYALRDVTATVSSIPLIAASIMSKKIAEGTSALVLDVKVGTGAFMKNVTDARELASRMVHIGESMGVKTVALLTDMSQPLGFCAGNFLEVIESIAILKGEGPTILRDFIVRQGEVMLKLVHLDDSNVQSNLENGKAYDTFTKMVKHQKGDLDSTIHETSLTHTIRSEFDGYVDTIDAYKVGLCAWHAGAGRTKQEDAVDPAAGVTWFHQTGDYVKKGDAIFQIHSNDINKQNNAASVLSDAITFSEYAKDRSDLILETVTV
jgi:thymidine phosphorylase